MPAMAHFFVLVRAPDVNPYSGYRHCLLLLHAQGRISYPSTLLVQFPFTLLPRKVRAIGIQIAMVE